MTRLTLFAAMAALFGCATPAYAQSLAQIRHPVVAASGGQGQPGAAWLQGGPVQSQYVVGSDGNTYIGLWIDAPTVAVGTQVRAPMDVSLVIDTSGSMSGEKIVNARAAATSFIETLADGDVLSIYGFGSGAYQLAAPTRLSSMTRPALIAAVQTLQASGGTNMYDALVAAEASVAQAPATHPVRRVVMISDGQANIGPSTPDALGDVAGRGTEIGAQVTAIGVGLDYDERTLGALAQRSAGRMYHLADPSQMAMILHNELGLLGATVAANAYIEITPAAGVQILGVEALPMNREGSAVRIPIGALHGGQHREVLVRAHIDTAQAGQRAIGAARLVFQDPRANNVQRASQLNLAYAVTPDTRAATASAQPSVTAMVTRYQAANVQIQATEMINRGQAGQADATLANAESSLRREAAVASNEGERRRLESQAVAISRSRAQVRASASAPAGAPAPRAAALENNRAAMDAMGF